MFRDSCTVQLSIVIPTHNEEQGLGATLSRLQSLRRAGHEVIVADGLSHDATRAVASPLVDRVLVAPLGRASQMNAGAAQATGEIFLFLHADTWLPASVPQIIARGFENKGTRWGRFDVRLSGRHPLLRMVELSMNVRSRLTGIATGDQAIFVQRRLFRASGGFPNIPLMEDVAFTRQLCRIEKPLCLRERVITSSRRWEENGIIRTILLMWRLRLAFAFGADPAHLARAYQRG